MGRKRTLHELFVFMNGLRVGTLQRQSSGSLSFTYHESWLQRFEASPISLSFPLRESPYEGSIVYNFFDNLLPDSELIRQRIQAQFSINTNTCFDILSYIGADCVGALQLLTQPEPLDVRKIEANLIDHKSISALLKNYRTAPLGMNRDIDFRISIAGAQEKTALLQYQNQWYLPKSTTPTTHIIKLPIGTINHNGNILDLSESIENEWLCLKILEAYGLAVNQAKIMSFEDVKTLVVKRFDRLWETNDTWIKRLPQEDMCQVLGYSPALKYESDGGPGILNIMEVLRSSYIAIKDRENFIKSVFLFWILGAIDGHAKNFSIAIHPGGQFQLTPLYDVISAYPIAEKRQIEFKKLKMAMSLKGKNRHYHWNDLQTRHWFSMANECQFPETHMQAIIEEVCDNLEQVIQSVSGLLPNHFPEPISHAIFTGMRRAKENIKIS